MNNSRGLYIHIPFCEKKCKYCDFVSFESSSRFFDSYIESLLCEAKEYRGEKINTVFIGGGTPSILDSNQLQRLIDGLNDIFGISENCEFTVEINPKTLDEKKTELLKKSGVNRLSVGVQSFCNDELSAIGRIHDAKTAYETVELIKKYGFSNFNLDIMLGLPHQTKKSLSHTLKTAVSLNPSHLSCYSLILEEGTPLYEEYQMGIYTELTDDTDRELYYFTRNFLKENGYFQYEISNFSKPGYSSKHNLKYWNCEEYIGLGVSAHSYIDGVRFFNTSVLSDYLNKSFHSGEKNVLTERDRISEYIIMRLRLTDGISEDAFFEKFKADFYQAFRETIDRFTAMGLIEHKNRSYRLTEAGIDVSNSVMCEFV